MEKPLTKLFSSRIQDALKSPRITARKLADCLGVGEMTISKVRHGAVKSRMITSADLEMLEYHFDSVVEVCQLPEDQRRAAYLKRREELVGVAA